MAQHAVVRRWSAFIQVGSFSCRSRRRKAFWVFAVSRSHHGGEGKHSGASNDHPPRQDLYTVLGVSSHASPQDIKLAFRKLARQYHPDVNSDSGAAEAFKKIRVAYETLADKTTRDHYDHSLRVRAHAAKKEMHRNYQHNSMYGRKMQARDKKARDLYWETIECEDKWQFDTSRRHGQGMYSEYYGDEDFYYEDSETYHKRKGPSLREGWENSVVDVLLVFCLVGLIWHALGVQLALTYFVFFIPHNKDRTAWYTLASLLAWLIGGTKGLALQYGIVTTGWLYGNSHDTSLVFFLLAVWMESLFPFSFSVPRGAVLLMAHICLGGGFPR